MSPQNKYNPQKLILNTYRCFEFKIDVELHALTKVNRLWQTAEIVCFWIVITICFTDRESISCIYSIQKNI